MGTEEVAEPINVQSKSAIVRLGDTNEIVGAGDKLDINCTKKGATKTQLSASQ